MKQTLTILTCTAALFGAITITQVTISGTANEAAQLTAPPAHPAAAPAPAADVDHADMMLDRLAYDSDREITPELVDQALAVAHEIDPELGDRLKAVCGEDPDQFERVLRTTGRRLIGLVELKENAPDLYDMKRREWRQEVLIARTTRDLADAKASDDLLRVRMLENELRSHIRIQLALQIAVRGDYIRRLKEHMQALEQELDRQAGSFDETVETRFKATLLRLNKQARGRDGNGNDVRFADYEE